MAPRSKVELLPEPVRLELEKRLIVGGFSGYEELANWLIDQGFQVSKSAVHRWGEKFEDRVAGLKIATEQARAVVEASPDQEGAMGQALVRLVQEKTFSLLLDMEIDPKSVNLPKLTRAIADMARAAVTQSKHASQVRKEAREELLLEQKHALEKMATEGYDADTLSAVSGRISIYLPDNKR